MRSQASKTLPKKGALGKTAFKGNSASKSTKKKLVSPKKTKNLPKAPLKGSKKNKPKDEASGSKSDTTSVEEKNDLSSETTKAETSKACQSRSNSPTKKVKKDTKEKKDTAKNTSSKVNTCTVVTKKRLRTPKIIKPTLNTDKVENKNDDAKYKINLETAKKPSSSLKAKVANKKGQNPKKKIGNVSILEADDKVKITDDGKKADKQEKYDPSNTKDQTSSTINDKRDVMKIQNHSESKRASDNSTLNNTSSSNTSASHSETPKTENERPPKFFTSSRSPRTVDIDVKCCKYSKGNLSVSERFLTMKCESKHEDNNKEKYASNHLVSQGAEIDVYTFTDKVDSPKSILSDFRNPINKSIGRVRPIARVKGTVIDKKTDTDRKKYSPHRPIEEVVKQLKANKRSEDIILDQKISGEQNSEMDSNASNNVKRVEDKPPPIVSKSYKMVARKSSITGKPFSPIKFLDESESPETRPTTPCSVKSSTVKQPVAKKQQKSSLSDEDINTSKFLINKKSLHYTSSEESVSESNDDNESNESSGSDTPKAKKTKKKKFKRITDSQKKPTSKELKELSKDSLIDLKDNFALLCNEKPSKRRLKLLSMWAGPKKHRMASLNAIAKVHCLYENESRTHMELGLMKTVDRQAIPSTSKTTLIKKKETKVKETEQNDSTSESEYEVKRDKKEESSDSSDDNMPQMTLRGVPGIRSAGKYWDPKSSTSSSEDSELEIKTNTNIAERKKTTSKVSAAKSDSEKPPPKLKKTAGVPVKKKRNRNEVVMDLKDMVVQKRMASLNATAILAASYEKRSPKSGKDDTTSDSCSDESFTHKSINITSVGVKSEVKNEDIKKDSEDSAIADRKQKVEVIVNQDTDVTITGVYSTHHEGFCTVSGMQYRISSTSHTQTTATANCEKEGCTREEGSRYTPLSALSSMQPPAEHTHTHPHPVPELGGLNRRPGCSSAFSAPSPSAHHDPGYYQPAGPLIKETSAEADRALGRYHPPPHYHPPHPSVLQQYGPPYYPAELCYGRYYRPPGPYHIPPPQPDAQMVGVGSEPYPPPPQYYGTPPCYQHSPQRIPYVEYRGCPCPLNACPKNVLIGPATGKAPAGGGPADVHALAPPGGAFRGKVRACALDSAADTHGSGKDPPLEPEPPAGADAPHPCPVPAIGGASPKRELYDVRENLRLAGDIPGPTEAIGPPSPARGSAGACAPQPPPIAPRRARLGKAMARRTLAGDDTSLLLSTPQQPAQHSDADDDVLAISPPICVPIDLSSSDERSTPLVDVKKENEGPKYATPRKADTQALREHNSSTALLEMSGITDANKSGKRRYSKPKLEIDIRDVQLDESCKTNGIGEHVKLQKRRKVSGDQTDVMRTETVTKETKKKTTTTTKRNPRSPPAEKKTVKRKLENSLSGQKVKKALSESIDEDQTLKNISCVTEEPCVKKPKTKSALLLDNLIRKNSIDGKGYSSDTEINPAELFLAPNENITQNGSKKTLNINNNVVDNNTTIIGVRPKTIAAVSQLIEKKLAFKNACNIDSKITHNLKSVLKAPTDNADLKEERTSRMVPNKDLKTDKVVNIDKCDPKSIDDKREKDNGNANKVNGDINKSLKPCKTIKLKSGLTVAESNPQCDTTISVDESHSKPSKIQNQEDGVNNLEISQNIDDKPLLNKLKITADKVNGELKSKNVEKVVKLLVSKKQAKIAEESKESHVELTEEKIIEKGKGEKTGKRCKLAIDKESKGKSVDKLAKILITKNTALKTDEATLVVEDACASPTPSSVGEVSKLEIVENGNSVNTNGVGGRRTRRRRSGVRRTRRSLIPIIPPTLQPRPPPRWSNGWNWDGEHYVSKVYLNNDSRLDRTARCWARMWHASGDRVARGDCVLLRASLARAQPFVARVASLWENPEDGEMMVSLVWYYRPEHTERGRQTDDAPDEVFASRHRDANSVACIEDKCYVLTFNEYCRYRKRLKATEEGITIEPSIVPPMPASEVTPALVPNDTKLPPSVSPELVLFCRKIYDFRSKKVQVPTK